MIDRLAAAADPLQLTVGLLRPRGTACSRYLPVSRLIHPSQALNLPAPNTLT